MLTTRILPPEEWERLRAVEPFASKGLPRETEAEAWTIVVVERDGELVGTCSLFTAIHWDCWWVEPAARGRGGVLSALLLAALTALKQAGIETVYTPVEDGRPEILELLTNFGYSPVSGRLFVLNIPKEA